MLCMYVHMSGMSIWLPSLSGSPVCNSALLAGKSGFTNTFAGILELSASLCIHVCMFSVPAWVSQSPFDRSAHNLVLQLGESGDFVSAGFVLMDPVTFQVVSMLFQIPGLSPWSLDASDQFPRLSAAATSHLVSNQVAMTAFLGKHRDRQ